MASAPDVGLNILVTADPQPPPGTVAVKPHGWHVHNGVLNQPGHKIHVAPEIAEALVARGRADLA
jgi:hypothetical protein